MVTTNTSGLGTSGSMCGTLGVCGFLSGRYRERVKRTRTRAHTTVVKTKAALSPTLRQTASVIKQTGTDKHHDYETNKWGEKHNNNITSNLNIRGLFWLLNDSCLFVGFFVGFFFCRRTLIVLMNFKGYVKAVRLISY